MDDAHWSRQKREDDIAQAVEEAVYPYQRCIEEIVEHLEFVHENMRKLCEDDSSEWFRSVEKTLARIAESTNKIIDKHGIREGLDLG
jgi:predicted secreted protein